MQAEPLTIWYKPLRASAPSSIRGISQRAILFSFSDARFNRLAGSRSTQSSVIILGLAAPFSNIVHAQGCLLWAGASNVARIARSSLGAEAVALSNATDLAI